MSQVAGKMESPQVQSKDGIWEETKEDVIGLIIALVVVNLVMNALFPGAWWATIAIYALSFGLIVTIVEAVDKFYDIPEKIVKKRDDMFGVGFAQIVLRVFVEGVGLDIWVFQLAIGILSIILFFMVIDFLSAVIPFLKERMEKKEEITAAQIHAQNTPQAIEVQGTEISEEKDFCPSCRAEIAFDGRFCLYCGNQF